MGGEDSNRYRTARAVPLSFGAEGRWHWVRAVPLLNPLETRSECWWRYGVGVRIGCTVTRKRKNPAKSWVFSASPAGFEPATFGLGIIGGCVHHVFFPVFSFIELGDCVHSVRHFRGWWRYGWRYGWRYAVVFGRLPAGLVRPDEKRLPNRLPCLHFSESFVGERQYGCANSEDREGSAS